VFGEGERGEGGCEFGIRGGRCRRLGRGGRVGRRDADGYEEAVEFVAVEGAEFHVAFDYAVEVDFLCFEVVQPVFS